VPWWRWLLVALLTAAGGTALELLGVPAGVLFAGLLVGIGVALSGLPGPSPRGPHRVPRPLDLAAQATLGVVIGTLVQPRTLTEVAAQWLPVLLVVAATLGVSVAAGVALGRRRDVGPVTGSLALTAGGASGLVSMAGELGADQRLVAVVQYLRVLLVTATLPVVLLVTGARGDGTARAAAPLDAPAPWWVGLLLVVVVGTAGSVLGRLARLPAGALLGPLVLAALVGAAGLSRGAEVPVPLVDVAYAVIGLQAGLSATRESLRVLRRALPAALLLTVAVLVACAGLGVALSAATGVSLLDGYLATTPGGLWAVLAASLSVGSDVTFVLAVQVMRLLVVLLTAPLLSRLLRRYAARSTAGPTPGPAAPARPRRRPRGRRRRRGAPG